METSLKTGFAQIFSCCPKNLSCPNFGGTAAPLASPARTPMATKGNSTAITGKIIQEASQWNFSQKVDDTQTSIKWTLSGPRQVSPEGGLGWGLLRTSFFYSASESAAVNKDI